MQANESSYTGILLTPSVIQIIQRVVSRMLTTSNFGPSDREDLIQDFKVALLKAEQSFKPEKGTVEAFANCVICRTRKNIYRHRIAMGLDTPTVPLLETKDDGEEGISLEELLPLDDSAREAHLAMDTKEILAQLPPDLQEVCQLLSQGLSREKIAAQMGIPATTFRRNMLGKIRKHFASMGFSFEA